MLDQDNNFCLISLSIVIARFLDKVWAIVRRSYISITSRSLRVNLNCNSNLKLCFRKCFFFFSLLCPFHFFFFLQHSCKLRYLKSVNRLSAARVGLKKKRKFITIYLISTLAQETSVFSSHIIKLGIQFGFVSKMQ